MIVNKTASKVFSAVIVVFFTAVMVFMHFRNMRYDASLADQVASDEVTGAEEQGSGAVLYVDQKIKTPVSLPLEQEPDPEPVRPPFVMKPVGGKDEIEGEYLVSFFDKNDRAVFLKLVEDAGGRVLGLSDYGNVAKVKLKDAAQLEEVLRVGPVALDYSANYSIYKPDTPPVNPPQPDKLYGVFGKNSLRWLGLNQEHIDWGRGVNVAVLDSRVEDHPAFKKDALSRIDIIGDSGVGGVSGHGTAVASLIAGWHPDVIGVAPSAKIINVVVADSEGRGDVLDAAKGIMRALEAGAQVINISMGTYGDSFVLRNAIEEAVRRGVVVVGSVGNDGHEGVVFPAAYEGVIGVSAVDAFGQNLYFANRGDAVDISAPGYGISAAWVDGGFVEDFSGTSASAAYVSGMVAALIGRGVSPAESVRRVLSLASDAGMPGRDPVFGNGVLDIRRIEEHGSKGIRDAAISAILIEGNNVVIGFQNRGTELLEGARVAVRSGDRYINFDIGMTKPGDSVSRKFELRDTDWDEKGVLVITAEIIPDGLRDMIPENNARRLVVVDRGAE